MKETELSKQESLELITSMINQAKRNYSKRGSFHFLLWGWVVMIANFVHYYLDVFTSYEYPYIVWIATIPAGVISGAYGARQRRKAGYSSHLDRLYSHVWMAVGIGVILSIVFMYQINYYHNAVILLFAGIGTYISGRMLRFSPLVFGGIALWITSSICFNVSISTQYLVAGIGIFAGYLIPGYMLKSKEK